jgi:hypothetical protein
MRMLVLPPLLCSPLASNGSIELALFLDVSSDQLENN